MQVPWIAAAVTTPKRSAPRMVIGVGLVTLLAGTSAGLGLVDVRPASASTGSAIYRPLSPTTRSAADQTSASLIREAHAQSGLTWDQIAKLFGVSRRSVHLWSNGGKLSAANHDTLVALLAEIRGMNASSSDAARSALLLGEGGKASVFDRLRSRHASTDREINHVANGGGSIA